MAGDWLKMRIDLIEDPAVIGMAVQLGIDEYAIVGRLHRLWGWANRQSTDGHAPSITGDWVDKLVAQPGFAAAMQRAGWLELSASGAVFPKFDRHNSHSAKVRVLATTRQQVHRSNASRTQRDDRVTREEEEKNITSPPPPAGEDAGFKALLAEYPPHRRNHGAALKRWRAIGPDPALQELMVRAARTQARSAEWQADQGKHVPNLSKWLHNEGWKRTHDELAPTVKQTGISGPPAPASLTREELAANRERARRVADDFRKSIAEGQLREVRPVDRSPAPQPSNRASACELRLIRGGSYGLTGHARSLPSSAAGTPSRFFQKDRPCG